jgi:hypothetical protein
MIRKTFIQLQGFLNDARQKKISTNRISNLRNYLDGYKLNEIQIISTLASRKDVQELIELLEMAQHCFAEPKDECECITTS